MKIKEINRRIRVKLKKLESDREERQQARQVLHRVENRVTVLREELVKVRRRIQRRRSAIIEVQQDLKQLESETPDEDTEDEVELRHLLDQLSGELEEALATRDRLLDRLDVLQEKQTDAKQALEEAVAESAEDREALQRLRQRRRRALEARKRNDQPSPNFDWAEFDCNDGIQLPEASKPAVRDWCQRVGEPVRAQYGSVHINSAFRHRAYNKSIGGEDNSVHIYDFPGRDYRAVAVDFRCERGTPLDWYTFTASKADGRGRYATFHHADTRNRIGWPDATWSG